LLFNFNDLAMLIYIFGYFFYSFVFDCLAENSEWKSSDPQKYTTESPFDCRIEFFGLTPELPINYCLSKPPRLPLLTWKGGFKSASFDFLTEYYSNFDRWLSLNAIKLDYSLIGCILFGLWIWSEAYFTFDSATNNGCFVELITSRKEINCWEFL